MPLSHNSSQSGAFDRTTGKAVPTPVKTGVPSGFYGRFRISDRPRPARVPRRSHCVPFFSNGVFSPCGVCGLYCLLLPSVLWQIAPHATA